MPLTRSEAEQLRADRRAAARAVFAAENTKIEEWFATLEIVPAENHHRDDFIADAIRIRDQVAAMPAATQAFMAGRFRCE